MLLDSILDELALGRNLTCKTTAADAEGVTFAVTFDVRLDRENYNVLSEKAAKRGHKVTNAMRRSVKSAFKFCFREGVST